MLKDFSSFGVKEYKFLDIGAASLKWAAIGMLSMSVAACSFLEKKKVEEVAPVVEVKEDPTDPAPWLKRAQESFAQGNYSETIRNANEVIARQSSNIEAKSLLVVSGLRIASRSLADLRSDHQVTGDARTEASEMVKTLREVLGENVLVPPVESSKPAEKPKKKPLVKKAPVTTGATSAPATTPAPATTVAPQAVAKPTTPAAPAAKPKGNSDPFGALR
jgi:hypothetical protein